MARAQGPDEDPGSGDAGSANPPSRSPSSGSKLPVEDPTFHEERGKVLRVRPDPAPSSKDAEGDPASEGRDLTLGTDQEQSVGALPVEDPTDLEEQAYGWKSR